MKCEKCRRKATINTIDGHFCDDHLPAGFCRGCGELVMGVYWHEEHINLLGVCGDCAEGIRNNVDSKSSVSFFGNLTEQIIYMERNNMAKTATKVKLPFKMKTMSKDEMILKYADESRRFRQKADGVNAVLSLLVRELVKQPQFAGVREKVEAHLNKDNTTLAATVIREHLEEQGSRGSNGVVIPDSEFFEFDPAYRAVTYGGMDTDPYFETRPSEAEKSTNPTVIIPDGSSFLEPKPIEEKSDDKKSSVIFPGFDAITY